MKTYEKSQKLKNAHYDLRGPIAQESERLIAEGEKVLKLNIGNPFCFGLTASDELLNHFKDKSSSALAYSDAHGNDAVRQAIYDYAVSRGLPNVSMDNIYTGNGVSELIQISLDALLNDGDEILIPSPDYPLWTAAATIAGGKVVHYLCDEKADWYPDLKDIESKITGKTKAIVVINPNNPSGAVYPKEILEGIAGIATKHDLIIFSDEIYDRCLLDDESVVSIGSVAPDVLTVTMSGLSKSHMLCGFRVGWMVLSGNKETSRDYIEGIEMLTDMRLCSNVPGQFLIPYALSGDKRIEKYFVPGGRVYEQRNAIYEGLSSIPGVSCVKPRAAFYIFPKIDLNMYNIPNDSQFALDLLRSKKILVVPGSGFNWKTPDHLRIVYLASAPELTQATKDIGDYLQTIRK